MAALLLSPNRYRHPHPGFAGALLARVLNSRRLARARHALLSRLPFPVLESDVEDVVYLTWLVDVDAVQTLIPAGLHLWQRGGKTPFTILTYRHGHFGPAMLGRLRKLFPSPLQSNWRFYLEDGRAGEAPARSVYFVENAIDSAVHVIGTRTFSDIMQTHLPAHFIHRPHGTGFETRIVPGAGSAPLLDCSTAAATQKSLPPDFMGVFGGWQAAVDFLACQDAALTWSDRHGRMVLAEIDLPIDTAAVQPLVAQGAVRCSLLEGLPGVGEPLCFLVPRVRFKALSERLINTPADPA